MNDERLEQLPEGLYAQISTTRGDIWVRLFTEETPITVANFVGLVEGSLSGANKQGAYYDGLKFHRVIDNFMIQGGDPTGTGSGGPGYRFADEIVPSLKFDRPGLLAMANAGPATNGSQFFITHTPTPHLNGKHTIFGAVVSKDDQAVVDSIKQGDTMTSIVIHRKGKYVNYAVSQETFTALQAQGETAALRLKEELYASVIANIKERHPNVVRSDKGAYYVITQVGTGNVPKVGQEIKVHYAGSLLESGREFDSSYGRGEPLAFEAGTGLVIPGWDEAVMSMKVGEKRTLFLPPDLAYGAMGAGNGLIPPGAWLVFTMERMG